jgi:hypothetical protein
MIAHDFSQIADENFKADGFLENAGTAGFFSIRKGMTLWL